MNKFKALILILTFLPHSTLALPTSNYDKRAVTVGESAGIGIASGTVGGAAIGFGIAGPLGAPVGALIGLGVGAITAIEVARKLKKQRLQRAREAARVAALGNTAPSVDANGNPDYFDQSSNASVQEGSQSPLNTPPVYNPTVYNPTSAPIPEYSQPAYNPNSEVLYNPSKNVPTFSNAPAYQAAETGGYYGSSEGVNSNYYDGSSAYPAPPAIEPVPQLHY